MKLVRGNMPQWLGMDIPDGQRSGQRFLGGQLDLAISQANGLGTSWDQAACRYVIWSLGGLKWFEHLWSKGHLITSFLVRPAIERVLQ